MDISTLTLDDETFQIASEEQILSVEYIERVWRKAGRPRVLEGETPWKVVDAIMQVWMALYPWEVKAWRKNLQEEQMYERTPHEVNTENGGYFPIAYPTTLVNLLRVKFPGIPLADHDLIKKFVERYPILKVTQYDI